MPAPREECGLGTPHTSEMSLEVLRDLRERKVIRVLAQVGAIDPHALPGAHSALELIARTQDGPQQQPGACAYHGRKRYEYVLLDRRPARGEHVQAGARWFQNAAHLGNGEVVVHDVFHHGHADQNIEASVGERQAIRGLNAVAMLGGRFEVAAEDLIPECAAFGDEGASPAAEIEDARGRDQYYPAVREDVPIKLENHAALRWGRDPSMGAQMSEQVSPWTMAPAPV